MNRLMFFHSKIYNHLFAITGLALCVYFSYHTIYGERSYSELVTLSKRVEEKQQELSMIKQGRQELESDVKKMRPDTISLDLLEERARIVLGYKKPDEYVIIRN